MKESYSSWFFCQMLLVFYNIFIAFMVYEQNLMSTNNYTYHGMENDLEVSNF